MRKETAYSLDSITEIAWNKTHAIASDLLRLEKINIYRQYIERMNATEIVQALAESRNEPVWREALEIYGPRRIRRLVQFGGCIRHWSADRLAK